MHRVARFHPARRLLRVLLCAAALLGSALAQAAPDMQRVELPLPSGMVLRAHWLPAAAQLGQPARPAVLALHGCGGLYAKGGALSSRYRETANSLHAAGYAVLMPDSFGSRGLRDVCQTRYSDRSVGVNDRVQDARAALVWLGAQPGVDARHIGVLGWSNGGTTVLHLLEQRRTHPQAGEPALAGAAVFYPGCVPLLKRKAEIEGVPLLMQLGALDDWTPAQPCADWAATLQARAGSDVTVHVYEGSYHGFDGTAPVRLRGDVPNGTSAQGVHQGGNPQARVQSLAALQSFWHRVLGNGVAP
ncbi:dienelactone hydrolase family protein [Acidovorax sp. RAC01]|uniref:dienelactone hydrolase family protein n=1 Tax=Acidovorax sp. RAC01 TaxID=1842533 RepID=UPI00083E787B|nr:prolyl oligopeptidase family serine peptidase [Acidovorax sp. RAC01]AOG22649.1 alpha/beta hydrolase fold family protein [Acidovorax sp. RAC01]